MREYIVVASGIGKKTGDPYSVCAQIVQTKDGGGFLSERDRIYLDEIKPVGSKVKAEQKIVV